MTGSNSYPDVYFMDLLAFSPSYNNIHEITELATESADESPGSADEVTESSETA